MVQGSRFRVQGSGVHGSGFTVQGSRFWVEGFQRFKNAVSLYRGGPNLDPELGTLNPEP
jgi:hypothetical protein